METRWTDEITERLKAMLDEGLTSAEIARCIPGATRNAVIGKIHRLGLTFPGRLSPERPSARRRRSNVWKIKATRAPRAGGGELTALNKDLRVGTSILNLERHHCRWPVSDNPRLFCGNQRRDENTPYCAAHAQIAYVSPQGGVLRRGHNRASI